MTGPMADVLLAARLVLGAVFILSGVTKLTPAGARAYRAAAADLGAPRPLAPVVPHLEVVLAALLLSGLAVRAAGAASLVLLGVFSIALGRALMRGIETGCGCFGVSAQDRIRPRALVRNGLLAIAAALCLWEPVLQAGWGRPGSLVPVVLSSTGLLVSGALIASLERMRAPRPEVATA